ncbi:MAG TPA: transcription elongation factor GreA [Candidatus Egerieenecus merdigallinarum]|nr:transcription elongation factor GreA [Candidatus Egerieenecus merdigallinarum]
MAEQQNKTVLTEEGLKKLEAQLDYLVSVRRNEVSEQIAIARGFGDLSENAEYDEAKKEQAKVEEEIVRLTNTIRTAVVVADSEISTEKVSVGTSVRVKDVDTGDEDVYAIVGAEESDPYENKISNESPVGAGLLGAKRGDVVSIEIPAGILRYEILDITR